MKVSLPFLISALLISSVANASQPPSLDEKLNSAFGTEERREVLRKACLNAVEKITGLPPRVINHRLVHRPNAQTAQAKELCQRMTDRYEDQNEGANAEKVALSRECAALIHDRLENGKFSSVLPLQNMRAVCQKLTGKKIACWVESACGE